MGPGRADQEWPTSPPRLVPQSDGYADYADQSRSRQAGPPTGPQGGAPRHRKDGRGRVPAIGGPDRAARQRSIRSTITILLVIPLLSLIALWAYAAVSTVGGAIANKNDETLNQITGAPIAALAQALETERADTFVWQSAHGHLPRTAMDKQRTATDSAISGFRLAAAKASGLQPGREQVGRRDAAGRPDRDRKPPVEG